MKVLLKSTLHLTEQLVCSFYDVAVHKPAYLNNMETKLILTINKIKSHHAILNKRICSFGNNNFEHLNQPLDRIIVLFSSGDLTLHIHVLKLFALI